MVHKEVQAQGIVAIPFLAFILEFVRYMVYGSGFGD